MEDFIHFVNLDDFYICHNLANSGKISSPTIAHYIETKSTHPIYTITIDELWNNSKPLNTFSSPRLSNYLMSRYARHGGVLGIGIENTRFLTDDEVKIIHKHADIEFEFERVRRLVNPKLPSRLLSLFLAENNIDGRHMLKNMFPHKKNFIITQMKINFSIAYHKADSQWFDDYFKNGKETAIYNYWKGKDFNHLPLYEYLIDGEIELINENDKTTIINENKIRHQN